MGKDFDASKVSTALSAFARLINPTHKKVFEKIFNTLETGLSKLGDTSGARTKAIFDELRETVDKEKAKKYFEKLEGKELKPFEVNIKVHSFLKKFLLLGGFDIELFGEQS